MIKYKDYCGFLPFYPGSYATALAAQAAFKITQDGSSGENAGDVGGSTFEVAFPDSDSSATTSALVEMPIGILAKLYWMSQGFDLSASDLSFYGNLSMSDFGGSGTTTIVSSPDESGESTAPEARTDPGVGGILSGQLDVPVDSYSSVGFSLSANMGPGSVFYDNPTNKWYLALTVEVYATDYDVLTTQYYNGAPTYTGLVSFQLDGTNIFDPAALTLYNINSVIVPFVGGTMTVNFNSFWTP